MFVHSDGQLRAAHLILSYKPLSSNFQAPKCQIKVKDPRLHQISIATLGFLTTDLVPKGVLEVTLPPQYTIEEATPSHLAIKEEEEKVEEEMVEVSNSKDDFEVFNRPQSPKVLTGDLGHLPSAD